MDALFSPELMRPQAVDSVAAYLQLLRNLPQTRLGVIGDGSGNVTVTDRTKFFYVRLGGTDGEVTEARSLSLLNPVNGDTVLLRRERPGGTGSWVIVEWYGAGTPPLVNCDTGTLRFWVQLGQYAIFEVTALSAGGGAGTLRYVNSPSTSDWIAAPNSTNLLLVLDGRIDGSAYWSIGRSTDEGDTFTETYINTTEVLGFFFSFWQMLMQDLTNGNVIYGSEVPVLSGYEHFRFIVTGDGGTSWANVNFDPGSSIVSAFGTVTASRHNNTDAICVAAWRTGSTVAHNYFQLIDKTGTVLETYTMPTNAMAHTTGGGNTERGYALRGCVKYGDPDTMFILCFNTESNVFKFTWSTKTLTDLGSFWATSTHGSAVHKQILSTRAGTLLIVDSAGNGGSGAWLIVWRSIDDGASWNKIELSSELTDPRSDDTWDYIAISSDDTMLLALNDGTALFSTDDGATWVRTGDFIPVDTYGEPHDICGAGM